MHSRLLCSASSQNYNRDIFRYLVPYFILVRVRLWKGRDGKHRKGVLYWESGVLRASWLIWSGCLRRVCRFGGGKWLKIAARAFEYMPQFRGEICLKEGEKECSDWGDSIMSRALRIGWFLDDSMLELEPKNRLETGEIWGGESSVSVWERSQIIQG